MEKESASPAPVRESSDLAICLDGDIDLANAAGHGDELCAVLDALPTDEVHVDCNRLEFLGSQGMAMMVLVHRHGEQRGIDVVWDGLAERHRFVLGLTGLDDYLLIGRGRGEGGGAIST